MDEGCGRCGRQELCLAGVVELCDRCGRQGLCGSVVDKFYGRCGDCRQTVTLPGHCQYSNVSCHLNSGIVHKSHCVAC